MKRFQFEQSTTPWIVAICNVLFSALVYILAIIFRLVVYHADNMYMCSGC